jgi:hypothetical protein
MKPNLKLATYALIGIVSLNSCLTAKKFDHFVAEQYNEQLPQPDKKKKPANVAVTSTIASDATTISSTQSHTKVLPLIVYWNIDYRHVCTLNAQIAISNFSKSVNTMANRGLNEKLNGRKLELTVQQIPSVFSLVDKTNVVWFIYGIHWDRVYIQPDAKDLVVAYKLYDTAGGIKTGTITIANTEKSKNLRFFQSWKSATSEYLSSYDTDVTAMSKAFVNKLVDEL